MTKPLPAETKRLHGLTPGALADEAGEHKAGLARIKDEMIRRELRRAESERFSIVITPAGTQNRLDRKAAEMKVGPLDAYCHPVQVGAQMTVTPIKRAK